MSNTISFFLSLLIYVNILFNSFESVSVHVSLPSNTIKSYDKLILSVLVKNGTKSIIVVPKKESFGYLRDSSGFFNIQLQIKKDGKYVEITPRHYIEYPPRDNYSDTLNHESIRKYNFFLGSVYHFFKGEYRIRILANFSNLNKISDIYSNWFYFKCEQEIIPPGIIKSKIGHITINNYPLMLEANCN